ncbi:MAG: hypothetical protein WC901_01240 [Candidatus Margulisiibacteriota bacterium]
MGLRTALIRKDVGLIFFARSANRLVRAAAMERLRHEIQTNLPKTAARGTFLPIFSLPENLRILGILKQEFGIDKTMNIVLGKTQVQLFRRKEKESCQDFTVVSGEGNAPDFNPAYKKTWTDVFYALEFAGRRIELSPPISIQREYSSLFVAGEEYWASPTHVFFR